MINAAMIDISDYQTPGTIQWEQFAPYIVGVIIKASMGGGPSTHVIQHAIEVDAAGIDVWLYHWDDPTQSWISQAGYFAAVIMQLSELGIEVKGIMYDDEQYWEYWSDWYAYLKGEISNSEITRISAYNFANCHTTVRRTVQETGLIDPDFELGYIGDWVLDIRDEQGIRYGTTMEPEYKKIKVIWADYTKVSLMDWYVTWEDFEWIIDEWLTQFEPESPERPEDMEAFGWQFQSRLRLPGSPGRLDTIKLFMTVEEYGAWTKKVTGEGCLPQILQKMTAQFMRAKSENRQD